MSTSSVEAPTAGIRLSLSKTKKQKKQKKQKKIYKKPIAQYSSNKPGQKNGNSGSRSFILSMKTNISPALQP